MGTVLSNLRRLNDKTTQELGKVKRTRSASFSPSPGSPPSSTSAQELRDKCAIKDFLIKSLVELIRSSSELGSSSMVRHLRESTYKPSYVRNLDFDLKSLCSFIESGASSTKGEKRRRDIFDKMVRKDIDAFARAM